MTATTTDLLAQVLALPEDERMEFAQRFSESIELHEEPELTDELKDTLDRRWEEITSGKVECRDGFEVLREIRAKYNV